MLKLTRRRTNEFRGLSPRSINLFQKKTKFISTNDNLTDRNQLDELKDFLEVTLEFSDNVDQVSPLIHYEDLIIGGAITSIG